VIFRSWSPASRLLLYQPPAPSCSAASSYLLKQHSATSTERLHAKY